VPTVLITGCSSGIGLLTAVEMARRGDTVVATMRNPDRGGPLRDAAAEAGVDLTVVALDVADDASVRRGIAEAEAAVGPLDVVVNNAGIEVKGPIEEVDDDEALRQLDTNVLGPLRVIRAVVPSMRERRSGTIVNVSSLAGLVARPFAGLYAASKHALEALSEALALEVRAYGVRVVVVEPGQFGTRIGENAVVARRFRPGSPYWDTSARFDTAIGGLVPGGEPADAGVVARVIADLAHADDPPLRTLVGQDAEMVMAVRRSTDFEGFEKAMRATLDWWD
jgi:NAD(P)-dependent dehydrogenase (short-subunit alcohol dehydrogenase family)